MKTATLLFGLAMLGVGLSYPTPAGSQAQTAPASIPQSNMLELPQASPDFVGDWEGHETGTFRYAESGVEIKMPAKLTSVAFGSVKGTISIGFDLYLSPDKEVVVKPKAWIVDSKQAVVEAEWQDYQYYVVETWTYQLTDSQRIVLHKEMELYDRTDRRLLGVFQTHARLRRLSREEDAAPAPSGLVPKARISASRNFQ